MLLALAVLLGDTWRVSRPLPDPPTIVQRISAPSTGRVNPSPDMKIEELIERIQTVEDMTAFLRRHVESKLPSGWTDFLWTYREAPEDLQARRWHGPCNNIAEFTAMWAKRHGAKPYIVSVCPAETSTAQKEDEEGEDEGETTQEQSWHQFTVCKTTEENHLVIFDNTTVTEWDGTIEQYAAQKKPKMTILSPVGGVIPWVPLRNDTRAKIVSHFQFNTPEDSIEVSPLPRLHETHGQGMIVAVSPRNPGTEE